MPNALAVTLAESAARTTSANGSAIDIGAVRNCARFRLSVSALSGTAPTVTVSLSTSDDGSTGWRNIATMPIAKAATVLKTQLAGLSRYVRASWVLGGTDPSVTFAITAVAHTAYAQPSELGIAIVKDALAEVSEPDKVDACIVASDEADGYLSGGYTLPITAWGDDLRLHSAKMATYHVLNGRGRQPDGPDDLIDMGYAHALKWLKGVAERSIRPSGIVDSTPDVHEAGSVGVVSDAVRGWW
jgi:phage gp36-like protein